MVFIYRCNGIPKMTANFGQHGQCADSALRKLITDAIRRSPKKRLQIAEELTAILGIRITENMLNDFTSENKRGVRFPLLFSAALCEVLGDDSVGLFGLRPRIRSLVEFAERELAGFRDQREREALRESLLKESTSARHSVTRRDALQPALPMDGQS
jgi:hypothetical protein